MSKKKRVISEEKTKELQKDWQGYGAMTVAYSLVVIIIVLIAIIAKLYFNRKASGLFSRGFPFLSVLISFDNSF